MHTQGIIFHARTVLSALVLSGVALFATGCTSDAQDSKSGMAVQSLQEGQQDAVLRGEELPFKILGDLVTGRFTGDVYFKALINHDEVYNFPQTNNITFAPLVATAMEVDMDKFKLLTQVPLLLVYGDYIPDHQVSDPGQDKWRSELEMARTFVKTVNDLGGDATLIHLPEVGIHGNTHFLMAEKNNQEIFRLIRDWRHVKHLD